LYVISTSYQPERKQVFSENFSLRNPYSGKTVPFRLCLCINIITPSVLLVLLVFITSRKFDLGFAGLCLAQSICLTLFFTEILKNIVTRPRPNYFSYCKYDAKQKKCTGTADQRKDSILSFPSGHSSNLFASGFWMLLFLPNL
jgi:membrane-associated phospholipid phosphatase